MPRICTVCTHPDRDSIDQALVRGAPSMRELGRVYGLSEAALRRHKADHLPLALVAASEASELARGDDLLQQVRGLQGRTLRVLQKAERAGKLSVALQAVREVRGNLELLCKLMIAAASAGLPPSGTSAGPADGYREQLRDMTDEELAAETRAFGVESVAFAFDIGASDVLEAMAEGLRSRGFVVTKGR